MPRLLLVACATILSLPLSALAAEPQAGTDDYLRKKGWTDAQLSEEIQTEERGDFGMTTGAEKIDDPIGDVLSRVGTSSNLKMPWGDIVSAEIEKNAEGTLWNITVELAAEVPVFPTVLGQLFFYADRDGDSTNNEKAGVRGLMDAEYTVTYNPNTRVWDTDYRWYNPEEDFWAYPGTQAMHSIVGNIITLNIPAAEILQETFPNWRVVMGVADSGTTQIDVAPGIGFPPARGQAHEAQTAKPSILGYVLRIAAVVVIGGLFFWTVLNKRNRAGIV